MSTGSGNKEWSGQDLQAASDELCKQIAQLYGDSVYFNPDGQPDRCPRFSTGLAFTKLLVNVWLDKQEWEGAEGLGQVDGKSFQDFASLIPREINGIPVEVRAAAIPVAEAEEKKS